MGRYCSDSLFVRVFFVMTLEQGYVSATANAVREGLLSLTNRELGGFRSAAEAAKEMMQEVGNPAANHPYYNSAVLSAT